MITERKALTLHVDGGDAVIRYEGEIPRIDGASPASLLLDARGNLVGVDLGGEGFARTVVMFGAHESVVSQRGAHVSVDAGALRIIGGASLQRAER